MLEEIGYDVSERLRALRVSYRYRLDPAQRARWDHVYGPDIAGITVVCSADVGSQRDPVLHGFEHDARAWYTEAEVFALLAWRVEADADDRCGALGAAGLGEGGGHDRSPAVKDPSEAGRWQDEGEQGAFM